MENQSGNRRPAAASRNRTTGKRRKVRYDRILIAAVVIIGVLVLMSSCTCSCVRCACGPSDTVEEIQKDKDQNKTTDEDKEGKTTSESTEQRGKSMSLSEADIHKGSLVIVNEKNEYLFPEGDLSLVNVYEKRNNSYTVSNMNIELDKETVDHLNQLLSEYNTIYGNSDIQVASGYRSKKDQQQRYSSGSSIFPGGYSDYHTGRSLDLSIFPENGVSSYYVPNGDYTWIAEHAAEYGFVLRYPDGKLDSTGVNPRAYTYHYAGIPHAVYMSEHDLCMEEYVEFLRDYPATDPLEVKVGETKWIVFYTPLSENGGTVINIPSCDEYMISGDNIGGFIAAYR